MNRREFIASSSLIALSGCATCRLPGPRTITGATSDAHAHFFNTSDLPVRGFIRHVIAPQYASDVPEVFLALADIAAWIAKRLTLSASAELAQLGPGELFGDDNDVSSKKFGKEVAKRQEDQINDEGFKSFAERDPLNNLADSHYSLALHLDALQFGPDKSSEKAAFGRRAEVMASVYQDIAENGAEASGRSPQSQSVNALTAVHGNWLARSNIDVKTIIQWVFVMCQPRCSHVRKYQETIRTSDNQVTEAANLLVDYDSWLGDRPLGSSNHDKQVEFWTRYRAKTADIKGVLKLHTFAGFDPLRDAGERLETGQSTTFEKMKQWVRDGRQDTPGASHKIAGFKIYPPMGFRPDSNDGVTLPECNTDRECRAAPIVRDWWTSAPRNGDITKLYDEIDNSLDRFFLHCAEEQIPIMTHARNSNLAMPDRNGVGYGNPKHWLKRSAGVYQKTGMPLKVCLGHYGANVSDIDVLRKGLKMNLGGSARMYFDFSYNEAILRGSAVQLLGWLGRVCEEVGDNGDYITFGSDWIMLGQDRSAPRYLERVKRDAALDKFWGSRMDKLFCTNFLDFVSSP